MQLRWERRPERDQLPGAGNLSIELPCGARCVLETEKGEAAVAYPSLESITDTARSGWYVQPLAVYQLYALTSAGAKEITGDPVLALPGDGPGR